MPLFISPRQIKLFNVLNKQLINNIIDTKISVYKINAYDTKSDLYGDALKRIYYPDVTVSGLIQHNPPDIQYMQFGINYLQQIQIKFHRGYLKQINLYVQIGDVIQ